MIVSWNWLKEYVPLTMPVSELESRLMMAGLNHEGTEEIGGDLAVDLEVTSNRPDCLGHVGIAREVAVLWNSELTLPKAAPPEGNTPVGNLVQVRNECPDLCFQYTARVIRGIQVAPSPKWMVRRLAALGIGAINNVVDISNYVLMECGQPLHTFDFGRLQGSQIVVRRPKPAEAIEAIDHKTYELAPDTCLICDARDPVAIGGVMGGAATEISAATTDVLIEAAEFDPVSIRNTARALNLHSDSSYRFERRVDPEGLDWASRRCCELILNLAGGELACGMAAVVEPPPVRSPVVLRFSQLKRILGIDVPPEVVRRILTALGNVETAAGEDSVEVIPPSWRRDLTREADLVEEVARIHGYDKIPEDVGVRMAASTRRREDRVADKARGVLVAGGFDEAMTYSAVDEQVVGTFSPWSDAEPLRSNTPILHRADRLRTSLAPSLLMARRTNETLANAPIELFEIAKVYLPRGDKLPDEQYMLGITSGRDYAHVKGVIETLLAVLRPTGELSATDAGCPLLDPAQSCRLSLGGEVLGYVGSVTPEGLKEFELRGPTTIAEVKMSVLDKAASLIPRYTPPAPYPAVTRDLNLVVDEAVRWADVARTVRDRCGELFEDLAYQDTYRDAERLGPGKKSLLLSISLRSKEGTMTSQQADDLRDSIVRACRERHGAELR